jgi:hypothetical protein
MFRTVDPIRQEMPVFGRHRQQALVRYEATLTDLRELDAQLDALAAERRRLAESLRDQHRRLWTNLSRRGRKPLPDGTESLPPVRHDARPLWGRRLRSVCLALLRSHAAPLLLVDLHALLHRRGFVVNSAHPVKALADALGYEALSGRVRRVARGTYELVPGPRPPRGRHGNPADLLGLC